MPSPLSCDHVASGSCSAALWLQQLRSQPPRAAKKRNLGGTRHAVSTRAAALLDCQTLDIVLQKSSPCCSMCPPSIRQISCYIHLRHVGLAYMRQHEVSDTYSANSESPNARRTFHSSNIRPIIETKKRRWKMEYITVTKTKWSPYKGTLKTAASTCSSHRRCHHARLTHSS